MRAHELKVGQVFYATWLGAAISPYLTVDAIERSADEKNVYITLPDGTQREFKAEQRVRVVDGS